VAEASFNRLKGNVDRLERSISTTKRSIKTNQNFVQRVDISDDFRKKTKAELADDEKTLKDLEAQLKEAKKIFNDFVKERRAKEGAKDVTRIEKEYEGLTEALSLQLDPNSKSAEDIRDKIDDLVGEYASAIGATQDRAVNKVEARAKLTKSSEFILGSNTAKAQTGEATGTPAQAPAPTLTPKPKPSTGGTAGGTTNGTTAGGKGSTTGGATGGASTTAFPQYSGVDTTTLAGIQAASARPPVGGSVVKGYDAILAKAQAEYNLPDIIFSNVDSLGKILKEYVDGKIDIDLFRQKVENDTWYRQNSKEIKARYLQKFNYEDLVKSGQAKGTTDYEQQIAKITNNLLTQARKLGSAIDEGQAKLIAEDLYIHNQDTDDAVVTRRLVSGIRPIAGMIAGKITEDYSGLALQNYQALQAIAKANGLKLENILPPGVDGKPATAQDTLKRIALGEIDPTRLEQDVRKLAAVGQPQFVRDLLGQGINLDVIYSPYKRTMSRILELDEGQIDLMDPTLRMGINEKGDVNLYDYEKALRQDSRWQYTGNAREAVSDGALTVLRNFGFQG
jgi:hypothetical protein